MNDIHGENICKLYANDSNEMTIKDKIELVISLLSWGFHHPIKTYLNNVNKIIAVNSMMIIDIRKGIFKEVIIIEDTNKYLRVCANKRLHKNEHMLLISYVLPVEARGRCDKT